MDYSVGSRIRVRLYRGKVVEAEITAIADQSAGRKVQIHYGSVTTMVNPAQTGRKVHISFGAFAFEVDETQILRAAANIA
jgi:hypothetical protein